MTFRFLPAALIFILVAGCAAPPEEAVKPDVSLEMTFVEQEPGVDPYPSRMLVTKDYLRLDDGVDAGNFVLYDRHNRTIASVDHDARNVLWIYPHAVEVEPPMALVHSEESESHPEAPTIAGRHPVQYRFITNGEVCGEVVSVEGLLEQGRIALTEYLDTLAGEQALNMDKTPPEMQNACELTRLIFAPSRHLAHGFPVEQWDPRGRSRSLVGFREDVKLDPGLFQIPADYTSFSVNPPDEK